MFIQRTYRKTQNKVYQSVVLMENYREGKNVKHKSITTLTKWPEHLVNDLEKLIKGKAITAIEDLEFSNGKSFGAIEVIKQVANRLGIEQALGRSKQAKLAIVQIAGYIIAQKSRNYIANEWAIDQDIENIYNVDGFDEDSLYDNLDWLSANQEKIEKEIFRHRYQTEKVKNIFFYDVSSSYLEGTKNELATYEYIRDKKKGNLQIIVGLMLDSYGYPVSIEVFKGNTGDTITISPHLKKIKDVYGVERVIFVADKRITKSCQFDEIISDLKCDYLATITKEQIKLLINKGVLQLSLFGDEITEVDGENNTRYILHRNKYRVIELKQNREARIKKLMDFVTDKNKYLKEHPKAQITIAQRDINSELVRLKLTDFASVDVNEKGFFIAIDEIAKEKKGELDGCYVIKTQVPKNELNTKDAYERYKDMAMLEYAFRTMNTTFEELRSILVKKEDKTKGHVFVIMLMYMITKYIAAKINKLNYSLKFAVESLDKIQYIEYDFRGIKINVPPHQLSKHQKEILDALDIKLNVAKKEKTK